MLLGAPSLRLVLFGGRGGVGKTSVATAAALAHADACAEQRCALISVDPAHSIRDCLANAPLPANLDVIEFDAAAALTRFKAERGPLLREVARRGTFLDDEDIDRFLDLSLPGLDEFMALLELAAMTERGDHARVFVDTAPIGHTLRLLSAPAALLEWLDALDALLEKHRYMREVFSGARRADDADLMIADLRRRTEALRELLASAGARFIAVVVPEPLCLQETATLLAEVSRLGVRADAVIVNHLRAHDGCPRCERIALDQRATLEAHPAALEGREVFALPELAAEARGREPLRALWRSLHELSLTAGRSRDPLAPPIVRAAIARAQVDVELVFVVGKGGVGKTTIACALALDAARRGEQVALISTDPAPSLATCLATTIDATPRAVADGLIAQVIDAPAEWTSWQALYRDELAASFGEARGFELRFDRQALERTLELSPPGIEEIVAVTRVLDILDSARSRLVVDTAATGHFLRLLEMPELLDRWIKAIFSVLLRHRHTIRAPRLSDRLIALSRGLKRLRALLRDDARARALLVTLPTEMAYAEAGDLLDACARLELSIAGVILNRGEDAALGCPMCQAIAQREQLVAQRWAGVEHRGAVGRVTRGRPPLGAAALTDLGARLLAGGRA